MTSFQKVFQDEDFSYTKQLLMSYYQDEQHFFLKLICHIQDLHGISFVEFVITIKVITCAFETKKKQVS